MDKREIKYDLFILFTSKETAIATVTYFANQLKNLSQNEEAQMLSKELVVFKEQLMANRKIIDILLQKADLIRTAQVWWPGTEENLYSQWINKYLNQIVNFIFEKKINPDLKNLNSLMKDLSDTNVFLDGNKISEEEKNRLSKRRF